MPRETIFVYYSIIYDELFTSKYPPPDMVKELTLSIDGTVITSGIYYIGVL
jgi:hypothetical protein